MNCRGGVRIEPSRGVRTEPSEGSELNPPQIFLPITYYNRVYRERKPEKLSLSGEKKGEKYETCDD
jgi:hypothetical protein